jgi:hypothetical protein
MKKGIKGNMKHYHEFSHLYFSINGFPSPTYSLHLKNSVLTIFFVVGDVLKGMPNKGNVTQFMNCNIIHT